MNIMLGIILTISIIGNIILYWFLWMLNLTPTPNKKSLIKRAARDKIRHISYTANNLPYKYMFDPDTNPELMKLVEKKLINKGYKIEHQQCKVNGYHYFTIS